MSHCAALMREHAILLVTPDFDLHQGVVSGVLNYHVHYRGRCHC
jgi:hypothetical protein